MRAAFTLVEVVAAAAIASIAGIALLQMNSQSTFLFSRLSETAASAEMLSLVGNHADKRFNRTSKSLYDLLDQTYQIDNDELRKYLQNERIDYSERVIETVSFNSDTLEANATTGDAVTEKEIENAAAAPLIQFELLQVSIKQKDLHGAVLVARPLL
jgi:type II secretory pathway pseudopilin PulG